jgi:hypothetical protein
MTAKITDFQYLIKEIAKSLDIDPEKAIPEQLPKNQQPQQPEQDPLIAAKAELLKAQAAKTNTEVAKVVAETAATNIKTQFGGIQTAAQIAINPDLVTIGDSCLKSSGYVDANGGSVAEVPEQALPVANDGVSNNTSPQFPANLPQPDQAVLEPHGIDISQEKNNSLSPYKGMETVVNEVAGK